MEAQKGVSPGEARRSTCTRKLVGSTHLMGSPPNLNYKNKLREALRLYLSSLLSPAPTLDSDEVWKCILVMAKSLSETADIRL